VALPPSTKVDTQSGGATALRTFEATVSLRWGSSARGSASGTNSQLKVACLPFN